jgi:hypothetical protein
MPTADARSHGSGEMKLIVKEKLNAEILVYNY